MQVLMNDINLVKSKKNLKAFNLLTDCKEENWISYVCFWQEKQEQINKKLILIWKYP